MKITFLGTGTSQGVPMIGCKCKVCMSNNPKEKRLRSSVLINVNGKNILIDAGPDFRQQMLREDINKLDAILITHEHKDHIGGLDDVRAFNYIQKKPMDIYAEERVCKSLQTRDFAYVEERKDYPGIPKMNFNVIENKTFAIDDIKIIPIRGTHMKLPVFGYRIKNFAYITDMNYISNREKEKLKNLDILVINALRYKKHVSHFNFDEALQIINEANPKKAYLTHISHKISFE
ncbi:MAG: MBL fold metallo-hydrolase, partial [Chlorobi bacterium]|nr:MBL fold metallo-hydrolase [Chlorobiota bacterium]